MSKKPIPKTFDPGDVALRQTDPFKIADRTFFLREASEAAANQYKNAMMACTVFNNDGKVSKIVNLADTESLLVSLCMFELTEKDGVQVKTPVTQNQVKQLPSRIVREMFKTARDMSELEDDDSIESLIEQRDLLNSRIKAMQEASNQGNSTMSESGVTGDGSDSLTI